MVNSETHKPLLLVFPFGLLSHYLRCIVLSRHLSKFFTICFADHPTFRHFVHREKFQLFQCESLDANSVTQKMEDFDFSWINQEELKKILLSQVKVIEKLRPAAVLGDHSPTLKMAAEQTGVKFVSLMNAYMSKNYAGTRRISRTHPAYRFLRVLPNSILDPLSKKGEQVILERIHHPFKKIRADFNLRKQSQYLDELEGDLTLMCDLPEIFPQKVLPETYCEIGPLLYSPRIGLAPDPCTVPRNKKTILVSAGSSGDWEKFAFLNDPAYAKYTVLATGDTGRVLNSAHVTHERFIDFHDVFPKVDLVICHGGNGTIYQALTYGIPVLSRTSHCEQEWNIDVLEGNRLGINLDRISNPVHYKKLVEKWIEERDNPSLLMVRKKIESVTSSLPQKAREIVRKIGFPVVRPDDAHPILVAEAAK